MKANDSNCACLVKFRGEFAEQFASWKSALRAMETAQQPLDRRLMSRIDILKKAYNDNSICGGEWLECAKLSLHNNGIKRNIFADAIVKLLAMGRGKGRNLYITGPANCGKTFSLDPLRVIYKTFESSATCSYAWLEVEETEVIFLDDFRYAPAILPWNDMLLLLEVHVVHFAAPNTSYARDIEFTCDTSVFATAKSSIVFIIVYIQYHTQNPLKYHE